LAEKHNIQIGTVGNQGGLGLIQSVMQNQIADKQKKSGSSSALVSSNYKGNNKQKYI